MQPQFPSTPVSSPSPNPQYDFILRDTQKPGRKLNLPRPILLLVGLVALTFIIIIASAILRGGGSSSSQQLIEVIGRAQEISRVSTNIQQQSQDPYTLYLAATVQTALSSEQYQITAYLKSHAVKISPAELLVYKDSNTDSQLQTAQVNNDLIPTFDAYLKTSLTAYQNSLKSASIGAPQARLALLNSAYASTQVLLGAPEITSAQ